MVTRNINNIDQAILSPIGTLAEGTKITFTLIKGNIPRNAFDKYTKEYIICAPIFTFVNNKGEFSVNLWPTDRALLIDGDTIPYQYQCQCGNYSIRFELLEDMSPIKWEEWVNGV